jgi:hypothetical protein
LVHVVVPSFSSTWLRVTLPVMFSVAPDEITVLPVPAMVPLVQVNVPPDAIVTFALPLSVPPVMFAVPFTVNGPLALSVPEVVSTAWVSIRLAAPSVSDPDELSCKV